MSISLAHDPELKNLRAFDKVFSIDFSGQAFTLETQTSTPTRTVMPFCLQCGSKAELKVPADDNRERIVCPNCNYIHYQNPNLVCGAVVTSGTKVLLCKRAIEPRAGFWTLPAGFMELGETLEQAAARETLEEAEATVTDLKPYCTYSVPHAGQVHMLFLGELQGSFGAGPESLECGLFEEHEIPWHELAFTNIRMTLEHFYSDRKNGHFPSRVEVIDLRVDTKKEGHSK